MWQTRWHMMDSCDMQIYMSRSWNVNTRAVPLCWHFNFGTYVLACHTRHHASFIYCCRLRVTAREIELSMSLNWPCSSNTNSSLWMPVWAVSGKTTVLAWRCNSVGDDWFAMYSFKPLPLVWGRVTAAAHWQSPGCVIDDCSSCDSELHCVSKNGAHTLCCITLTNIEHYE